MELLKKVILKDLELHFGKPLDNQHLYSCLGLYLYHIYVIYLGICLVLCAYLKKPLNSIIEQDYTN